ncbi:MAG: hypothetical protein AB7I57_18330 [Pirellulales bacterium]
MSLAKRLNYERTVGGVKTRVEIYAGQVLERVHNKRNRVCYKTGAYTSKSIQRSMRYATKKKQKSEPGDPPLAHKGTKRGPLLRKLTRFSVDESAGSVIAGPMQASGSHGFTPVPELLDKGGRIVQKLLKKTEYKVGDIGPIRYAGHGRFGRIRLLTEAQAARASRLSQEENAVRSAVNAGSARGIIAPRPFTAPAFTDGGKRFEELIETEAL